MRPKVLIVSSSDISVDPRVMKQVRCLVEDFDVTTCGLGPKPHPDVEHVELDGAYATHRGRIGEFADTLAREAEWFSWTYRQVPMVRQVKGLLRGQRFDAAIANDADTVGLVSSIVGARRVHADLHEFYPGLPYEDSKLGRRQRRYWVWLTRKHCARAKSATTVGRAIAERYHEYGLRPGVVTNAAPFQEGRPTPTPARIRLVHSGNAFHDRGLAEIMRAVATSSADVTLDLYLVKTNPVDYDALADLAERLGERIVIHDPVPQHELIETISRYDVGIHVLPPTSENNALALPNKFFDFVQARLGVIVGPSEEMARIVSEHGLGIVTESFSEDAIRAALDSLSPDSVDGFKAHADAAAYELAAERSTDVWVEAVRAIVREQR